MNIVERLMQVEPDALDRVEEEDVEIKRLSRLFGEPFLVRCKGLPGGRYTEIASGITDKKGKVDVARAYEVNVRAALAGIVSPDLKDGELQAHFKCKTPKDLLEKLFNGGEISKIADTVTELSGYGEDADDEIKN